MNKVNVLIKRVRSRAENIAGGTYELGCDLRALRRACFESKPRQVFQIVVRQQCGMSYNWARCLIETSTHFTKDEVRRFGWSKLHFLFMAQRRRGDIGKRVRAALEGGLSSLHISRMMREDLEENRARELVATMGRPRRPPSYESVYRQACLMIREDRTRLFKALKRLDEHNVDLQKVSVAIRRAA